MTDVDGMVLGEPDYGEPAAPLRPEDRERADWHLAQMARIRRIARDEIEAAQKQARRYMAWAHERMQTAQRVEQWHLDALRSYHQAVLTVDPGLRTLHLPNGALTARRQQPVWEFDDAFLHWAGHHARDLVRVPDPVLPPPAVDKKAAKALLTQKRGKETVYGVLGDGEVPPGVTVTERDDKFEVRLTDDEPDETMEVE